jgi:SAM-dependent methyltransferase
MSIPKSTSFAYGKEYQLGQVEKYRNRRNNHWKFRIELVQRLVEDYALPRLEAKQKKDIVIVDVGCSIGTFAIEFAKMGYCSYGIDFDNSALEIARQLAQEENVSPIFVCNDISDWGSKFQNIDIAICSDIFEHLHDDELGSFLVSIKKQLSKKGILVFHTFPLQYDYIFFSRPYIGYPLIPFSYLSNSKFNIIVKIYSCFVDIGFLLTKGAIYKEIIKRRSHCNPTTTERLTDILQRSGYEIIFMDSSNLYDFYEFKKSIQKRLAYQSITHRNLYGVAIPKVP